MSMATTKRLIRTSGGYVIRRLGLLPGAIPDGIGDDKRLLGKTLPHTVMVYFPDSPEDLYQLEQWYGALRALDKAHRVVVVLQDSRTAKRVRAESGLDAIVVARQSTMDSLVTGSGLKVAIYVNHHPENFTNLRFGQLVHVSLLHGDSDKAVSVSNQTKAYDYALVAGDAAADRFAHHMRFFDADTRCLRIGRPQLDDDPDRRPGPRRSDGPQSVLYAPTWEGSESSSRYGSVESHGMAVVSALINDGMTIIYRPHPLTGISDSAYADADSRIRALIAERGGPHRVDTDVPLARSFNDADLLICDISGVAADFLAYDRPLIVTEPDANGVLIAATPILNQLPRLMASDADSVAATVRAECDGDPHARQRRELVDYYLGDITPGASTKRFVEAIERAIATATGAVSDG